MTPDELVIWGCDECGATGQIDPVNDPALAVDMVAETHKLMSPDCPVNKLPRHLDQKLREQFHEALGEA